MNSKLDLHIFDFDGTLFKSPEPNPNIWSGPMVGKLKGTPAQGGLGWFQETFTLDDPYVPLKPIRDEWFHKHVLESAILSANNDNHITCLLTGRTTIYNKIIDRILESVELKFNHIGLKPVTTEENANQTTFDFKKSFINNIFHNQYTGQIRSITVYEDRIKHVELFRSFLQTFQGIEYEVKFIDEAPKYLLEHQERQLVNQLIQKNQPELQLKFTPDYTCIRLHQESIDKLLSWFELPDKWVIKTHHVTLNMSAYNPKMWLNPNLTPKTTSASTLSLDKLSIEDNDTDVNNSNDTALTIAKLEISEDDKQALAEQVSKQYPLGKEMTLQVESIGLSSNALAVRVYGCLSANKIIHCTIAIHPQAAAVDSNYITNWVSIKKIRQTGEYTLHSHTESQLKEYQQKVKDTKPEPTTPGKSPSKKGLILPPISCKVKLPPQDTKFEIHGVIEEVGKTTVVEVKKQTSKGGDSKQFIFETIKKHHKDSQEVGKLIGQVNKWIKENNITSNADIENFIQTKLIQK
ncbi:OB fold-containing protein [Tieghemostelium lacteum]|uniref:OB fold-containing protein n=1 Tax=Tieghemostelium lacteum TaxID=361077 RepID=A0A152AAN5_TIELA|nr:OB fold-containing protein [Tieghemostelium lacteum]|eukprot:KYR03137.1 OB fold-containing protein [Tieghemostelium lacteum]